MFKNFYKLKVSHIVLGVTTVFCTINGWTDPLLAQQDRDSLSESVFSHDAAKAKSRTIIRSTLINPIPDSYELNFEETLPPSHSSEFLLTQDVDWDAFCEKFPQNSMCQVQREQEEQSDEQQPEPAEPSPQSEPADAEPSQDEQSEPPQPPKPPEAPDAESSQEQPSEESDSESQPNEQQNQQQNQQNQQQNEQQSDSESDSNDEQPEQKWGPLNENSGVAFEPQVSSLGLGMDITARVSENINARAGFGVWSLTEDYKKTDVKYNADINLRSGAAVMDIYPIEGTEIRLSGGIMLNANQVNSTGQSETVVVAGVPQEVYRIGGRTFSATEVGTLSGEITFPLVAPFVGVGWGNAVKPGRRLGFTVDLGVMIHGTPQISLRATNQAVTPQLQESIDKELEDLKAEFDGFKFYPVLQVGVSYQF